MKLPEYKTVSVSSLIPYARNSRTHSDEQVTKIAASIKEFGFLNPVIVDGENGIIAGHGRIMAAKKLGIESVPVVEACHLTDAQKRAYIIADNRLALDAGWDDEMLRVEFAELEELGFDLALTGFELDEIELIELGEFNSGDVAQNEESGSSERGLDGEKYTTKIDTPIYEIKGDKPAIGEIYSTDKTSELTGDIMKADLPDDIRAFLLAAATRHTVFNYEQIAEFYAHQEPEVKNLMERSALVIIDYNQAIENGFAKLSKDILELREQNNELLEDEE